jgi:hypothetical protein
MYRKAILAAAFFACTCFTAKAADNIEGAIDAARKNGGTVRAITPIFSQLLMFSFPAGFVSVSETASPGGRYIQESVLKGETAARWSQMITVTGAKGLSANQNITPQLFLGQIAGGFKRACPDTFASKGIGSLKISGFDAFIALVGCGTVQPANDHSETALLIAIKRPCGRAGNGIDRGKVARKIESALSDQAMPGGGRRDRALPKLY